MEKTPLSLGFLASHNGTDMQAIVAEIDEGRLNAQARIVVSNNSASPALLFARGHEPPIPAYHISSKTHEDPHEAITEALLTHNAKLIICSGFMKPIGGKLLAVYENKIWNPHPADTRKYPGLWGDAVHEAVLKSGEEYTFPTIHIVDEGIDTGEILAQGKVKIEPSDTIQTLKDRVQTEEVRLLVDLLHTIS